jgi:hypothetical protein
VKATVSNVQQTKGDSIVTLQVEHVYCGTAIDDLGKFTTIAWGKDRAGDTTGELIYPSPTVGETGIWVVERDRGQVVAKGLEPQFDFCFPARHNVEVGPNFGRSRYDDGLELASAVEAVWDAPHGAALDLLKEDAFNINPEISLWAIGALAQIDPIQLRTISTHEQLMATLPVVGTLMLDKYLASLDGDWCNSGARISLLYRSATRPSNEYDSRFTAKYFDVLAQHPNLAGADLARILESFILDEQVPIDLRRFSVRSLGRMVRGGSPNSSAATDALSDIIVKSGEKSVCEQAKFELKD